MAESPQSSPNPLVAARPGPSFLEMAEASRGLEPFTKQGRASLDRFNNSLPRYRSRSVTPFEIRSARGQQDDPALLQALEDTARRFPTKWAANPYAGMTQEQKRRALARGKELDQQIAKRKQEEKERADRPIKIPNSVGLFSGDYTPIPGAIMSDSPQLSSSMTRKRKRNAEPSIESETKIPPAAAVQPSTGRPCKRTRTAGMSPVAFLEPKIPGPVVQKQPIRRLRQREKKAEALPPMATVKGSKSTQKRKFAGKPSSVTQTNRQLPRVDVISEKAARKLPASKPQTPTRRSKRIAEMAAKRLKS